MRSEPDNETYGMEGNALVNKHFGNAGRDNASEGALISKCKVAVTHQPGDHNKDANGLL